MSKNSEPFTLPPSPKGLCFDKNYFLGDNFSVDGFLHDHRNAGTLESMRDDLGVYLKVLRSAMIELINKDYADFVNLSANLIGLDKEINNIQTPLGQLREEVLHVRECLFDAMKELSGRLEQRKLLREKKRSLHYLSETLVSLSKLNTILFNESEDDLSLQVIERASLEFNHLGFTITKCEQFVTAEQKDLKEKIGNKIQSTLGEMFLYNLNNRNIDKLQQCLQIFSMLDKIDTVEMLFRKEVIAPSMHDIICEVALQKNPNSLKGVYTNILSFIDVRFKDLLAVTSVSKKSNVHGYNFLLNSFWPEVEYRIEVHMASIFAPGNPDLFYSRYNDSLEFLNKFLQHFESRKAVEEFFAHPQYKSFQHRWNLPVYFQIRFQEIAGALETILSEPINENSIMNEIKPDQAFSLKATNVCWSSLTLCWTEGIFILALAHRFWKLTLQLISRYSTWASATAKQLSSSVGDKNKKDAIVDKNILDKTKFQLYLYVDVVKLVDFLPSLLNSVNDKLRSTKQKENLEKSLMDAKGLLLSHLPQIKKNVVSNISEESVVNLKQLNDIPRLFRKTNRDIPTKPSGYVALLFRPTTDFQNSYGSFIGESNIEEWLIDIFSVVTSQYFTAVDDVLTSVQRTEESLRRLKHIRDRSSQTNLEKMGVTDDDKIRLQLKVDVQVYVQYLTDIKLNIERIDKIRDLQDLVDRATNKSNQIQVP